MEYVYGSFQGLERKENKDVIKIIENDFLILFLVFDGISSSDNAILAINNVINFIENKIKFYSKITDLENLIFEANENLVQSKIKDGFSTYAGIYFEKNNRNKYYVSNLGDTRVYLINNQSLSKLTIDDNLINNPNIVTKYLGMLEYNSDDFFLKRYNIDSDTKLLICSDGFSKFIENKPSNIHKTLNFKRIKNVKKNFDKLIFKNNIDDASYIFISIKYV